MAQTGTLGHSSRARRAPAWPSPRSPAPTRPPPVARRRSPAALLVLVGLMAPPPPATRLRTSGRAWRQRPRCSCQLPALRAARVRSPSGAAASTLLRPRGARPTSPSRCCPATSECHRSSARHARLGSASASRRLSSSEAERHPRRGRRSLRECEARRRIIGRAPLGACGAACDDDTQRSQHDSERGEQRRLPTTLGCEVHDARDAQDDGERPDAPPIATLHAWQVAGGVADDGRFRS